MTVASDVARVSYPGPGAGPFAIPFKFFSFDDLAVLRRDSLGVETELVNTIDYTGTGERDAAGTLTLTTALVSGETVVIVRDPAITQTSSFRNQSSYFGSSHEDALDQLVMQQQALADRVNRAVALPPSLDPATHALDVTPETGKALVWQSATALGNSTIDATGIALPGSGRKVATTTAYLLNNAVFNLLDYVDVGDTGYGPAFGRWTVAINAAGGGTGYIPPGAYTVSLTAVAHASPVAAVALCAFSGLNGFRLECAGVTITDSTTYAAGTEAVLFSWTSCRNIDLGAQKITTTGYTPFATQRGLIANLVVHGCATVVGSVDITGGQSGIYVNREYTDAASYRSVGFDVAVVANGTQYPFLCRFSGDSVTAAITATGCGRNYYAIGCASHQVVVTGTNQTGTTIIGAFNGFGCSDIELWYRDVDSTAGVSTSPCVMLQYADTVAATHKNITVHLNIVNPTGAPFYYSFVVNKVNSDPTGPGANGGRDVTGRGHVLDGLLVDGTSQQINGVDHLTVFGAFVPSVDFVRNVRFEHLTLIGSTSAHARLGNLLAAGNGYGPAVLHKITCFGGLFASESGTVTGATNATPIVLSFGHELALSDGMQVTVANVGGTTNANGTRYVKRLSATTFSLYTDSSLTTAVAGNGAYTSGGTVVVAGTSGVRTVYTGCQAVNFTDSTADFAQADYIACAITSGSTQSTGSSKTFLNTTIGGLLTYVANTLQAGLAAIGGQTITWGAGTPEGAITAPVASLYLRTNGGASTTLYVKETGSGNTGWVAK